MTIALFATEPLSSAPIASSLVDEGVDVRPFDLNLLRGMQTFGPEINKGVLIVSKHGAGDETAWFSHLLSNQRRLILCTPLTENEGYGLLKDSGATVVITPRSWAPEHVSERILAQLILDGDVKPSACGNLQGATRSMRDSFVELAVIAPLADPVLILGETGTGKELVAREIHNLSKRPDKFLPINCGELSLELAGSDLFGHKKGSYTGATEARQGLLAEAGKGTVFLDEIGELDLKAQAILLRVLEEKKVRRVGSNQTEDVPARIVLATNRDLELECDEGRFRQDLFERIRGFTLELKPLRERRADIPLLAGHFLAEFNQENGQAVRLPGGALDCLFNYEWSGNARELRAAVRRAAAFADTDGFISAWHLLQATRRGRKRRQPSDLFGKENAKYQFGFDPVGETLREFVKRAEAAYLQAMLTATGGNKKEASRLADLSLSQLYEKLKTNPSGEK
jgi:DNA-binding NtrC family response regulator